MPNCPNCDAVINEEDNFCFKCGTPLSESSSQTTPLNTLSLEEKQTNNSYSKNLKVSFTDNAVDKLASFLGDHISGSLSNGSNGSRQITQPQKKSSLLVSDHENIEQSDNIDNDTVIETNVQEISDNDSASNYFEKDGNGVLMQKHSDYKGKSKKAQQERFILVYVWAYNILFQEPVPNKKHLTEAAKKNNIYDSNFTTRLNNISQRYLVTPDDTFKLNPSGSEEVEKIQTEMADKELKGNSYWNSTRKNSNKASRITNEEIEKIDEWIDKNDELIDNFDIGKLNKHLEFAIFALYAITKKLNVENTVKPALAYEYLKKKYTTISVTKKRFGEILAGKNNKKYFEKTPEGLYYLTQEGENIAQELMTEN
ncbi:zinc ribbon domain-containing protein [Crocosphaera sp.]|uniref:zinc ribbon domain-containing protein n=1 Tax=Crocosphaera sp. TaxID=2729996 RepID=UPI00260A4DE8|nr:zinc ribbon domain-containing protein [Crocosphaera sp.]MDJ0579543.1 zinc ribbon domain-containing protein [Crocosphaera sp.]